MKGDETDMPEFPPVTMYTLPVRTGRESGWKVILGMNNGNQRRIEKVEGRMRNRCNWE
jgi:hypothetical protein